jgi:hypothetical protein
MLPSRLISIDGAGDLLILALNIAGSRDLVVGNDEVANLVALVSADVGMNGPLAYRGLCRERRRC